MSLSALLIAQATAAPDVAERDRLLELAKVAGLREGLEACTRCSLRAGCSRVVPWSGPAPVDLAVSGEGPGGEENDTGIPFVGVAGRLLDAALEEALLERSDVACWNVVSCQPPGNRTPTDAEIEACSPWWEAQAALLDPLVVVACGATAIARALRLPSVRVGQLRGRLHRIPSWPGNRDAWLMPTWHPAYVARQGGKRGPAWKEFVADVQHAALVAAARSFFPAARIPELQAAGKDLDAWRASAKKRLKTGVALRELATAGMLFAEQIDREKVAEMEIL